MGTFSRAVRVAVVVALFGVGSAAAQDAPRGLSEVRDGNRGGFWLGLALGAGGESYDLEGRSLALFCWQTASTT